METKKNKFTYVTVVQYFHPEERRWIDHIVGIGSKAAGEKYMRDVRWITRRSTFRVVVRRRRAV